MRGSSRARRRRVDLGFQEIVAAATRPASGVLFLGHDSQLSHYLLKSRPALFVGAGGHRSWSLLCGVTVVHVTDVGDLASQGYNVSQHIGGVHSY